MTRPLHFPGQQPRNQYIRAKDDHEAPRDHATVYQIHFATGHQQVARRGWAALGNTKHTS
jgi:hypothetical protein